MIKNDKKVMFSFIKNIRVLTGLVNESNHTKFLTLTTQKCTTQPATINSDGNE